MNNSIDGNQKLKKLVCWVVFFFWSRYCVWWRETPQHLVPVSSGQEEGDEIHVCVLFDWADWVQVNGVGKVSVFFFLFEINKQISIYGRSSTLHQSVLERWKHISMVSYAILTHSFIECVLRDWRNVQPREEERVENISHIQLSDKETNNEINICFVAFVDHMLNGMRSHSRICRCSCPAHG